MTTATPSRDRGWRTVDIVVAAVVAVAFGVVFLAWNALAVATDAGLRVPAAGAGDPLRACGCSPRSSSA